MHIVFIEKNFVIKIIVLIQNSCRWAFYAFMPSCFQIKMSGKFFVGDTEQQKTELFLRNRYFNAVFKATRKGTVKNK